MCSGQQYQPSDYPSLRREEQEQPSLIMGLFYYTASLSERVKNPSPRKIGRLAQPKTANRGLALAVRQRRAINRHKRYLFYLFNAMRLSLHTDYALRTLLFLATKAGRAS